MTLRLVKQRAARLLALFALLWSGSRPTCTEETPPSAVAKEKAISKAVTFLVGAQNKDGSWGSLKNSLSWEGAFGWNPETHRSWRLATTGLACIALMDHADRLASHAPLEKGIDFMIANADVKRCSDWDTDHVWGWIYALEALACAEQFAPLAQQHATIRPVVDRLIRNLAVYQTPSGGWAYYDEEKPKMRTPQWATSFTTSNALLALREAREGGHPLPPGMLLAALRAIRRSRLPDGSYNYSVNAVPSPGEGRHRHEIVYDPVKFSLSRIQVCNLALFLEKEVLSLQDLEKGLETFLANHKFLDVACYRPVPHEAYYLNAGYFYLYGHAYAARLLGLLPAELQNRYRPRLEAAVLKIQEPDGSFWDFPFQGYGKPSGTAFALMALAN